MSARVTQSVRDLKADIQSPRLVIARSLSQTNILRHSPELLEIAEKLEKCGFSIYDMDKVLNFAAVQEQELNAKLNRVRGIRGRIRRSLLMSGGTEVVTWRQEMAWVYKKPVPEDIGRMLTKLRDTGSMHCTRIWFLNPDYCPAFAYMTLEHGGSRWVIAAWDELGRRDIPRRD